MKLETKLKMIHRIWVAVPVIVAVTIGMMLLGGWISSPSAVTQVELAPAPVVASDPASQSDAPKTLTLDDLQFPTAMKYESVEAYFKDGNPNPLSHRIGQPRYKRDVTEATKKRIRKRDGNCCLVCGSTRDLEVDHRIALMNNGDNSEENIGTLCDSCHVIKRDTITQLIRSVGRWLRRGKHLQN